MSFTAFLVGVGEGRMELAMLGKGRKAREGGKEGFLRGALGLPAAPVC